MAKKEKIAYDAGCVLYVDGGCRSGYQDGQYGGWGFHGYTYPMGKYPPKPRTKKDVQTKYGYLIGESVKHEDQVVVDGYVDAFGSMNAKSTNNQAELEGMKNALDYIKEKGIVKVHLLLDSQYVLKGLNEYFPRWEAAGWKKPDGSAYINKELWYQVMGLYNGLKEKVDITTDWVNGHSGNLGNDRADYLATKGVFFGRNGQIEFVKVAESENAHYRDPKPLINRLFTKHRLYFTTNDINPLMSQDGHYIYHCGAHGSDDTLVGKPISDSVACVLFLKEQEKVLEAIRQQHIRLIDDPYYHLCLMRLDNVLLPRVYDEIEKDGVNVLSLANKRNRYEGLCTIDNQQVTSIIRPSGLTSKLVDTHNQMHRLYEMYKEGKLPVTDLTSHVYNEVTKKVKKQEVLVYESKLTPNDKQLKLRVRVKLDDIITAHYPVILAIGIDTPSREVLAALGSRLPKLSLITWTLSPSAFRYALIIEAEEDAMIWMGKDSNMQIVFEELVK